MIPNAFINLAYFLVTSIIGVFPTGSGFPASIHTGAIYIGGYLGMIDALVPIYALVPVMALLFGFEIAVFGFKTLKWIISHIPFIGGRG